MPDRGARERRLAAVWYGREAPSLLLRILAKLYGGVLALRRRAYGAGLFSVHRIAVPVVVVGNVTVGGTGKSPLTAWLAERLHERGRRPGIASRGYGRRTTDVRLVASGDAPEDVGDEPLMLARQTGVPVCVAARRADAAQRLVDEGCDVILCDDGLQHLALARDFELAVLDGARGVGNGRLLPAGPLREPVRRLAEVDAVVVHGEGASPVRPRHALRLTLAPSALRSVTGDAQQPLEWLRDREVHAVTGIGHPERFFTLLRQLGARVREHAHPDHHRFIATDLAFGDALPVLMTAKDAVKCAELAGPGYWVLPVTAVLSNSDAEWLLGRILALRAEGLA
ncbi:MAG: tetraacyldisaccharide 4'-kinase [Steroidobacteraceae bacterium]